MESSAVDMAVVGLAAVGQVGRGARVVAAGGRGHHLGTAAQDIDGDVVRLEQGTAGRFPAAATGPAGAARLCRSDRE